MEKHVNALKKLGYSPEFLQVIRDYEKTTSAYPDSPELQNNDVGEFLDVHCPDGTILFIPKTPAPLKTVINSAPAMAL